MSRRVYLLAVGLALIALALAFTDWGLSLRPGVTERNSRRLRPGMTIRDAEATLGERGIHGGTDISRGGRGRSLWIWGGTDGVLFIHTDANDRIDRIHWIPRREPQPGSLARLRAWLGW